MYVAVKGGEAAIANAHRLLADRRRGDRSVPALRLEQIVEQLGLAVDRAMGEGSLYDRELAALAILQARGDLIEAIFLVRAYRTTLPRFGYSRPIDTGAMRIERRISATYKDLPGGQLLGPTFDYTHRLLDPTLASGEVPDPLARPGRDEQAPRVTDLLGDEGLIEPDVSEAQDGIGDLTREPLEFPLNRDLRLQALARGDEGFLLALGYSTQRGYGRSHPFVGEIRIGEVEVELDIAELGFAVSLGRIRVTECQMVNKFKGNAKVPPQFTRGYGLVFGQAERKAMAMSLCDRSLRAGELGEETGHPAQDEEFVISHCDNVQATGFVEHLKLPHYVDFQGELGLLREMRAEHEAVHEDSAYPEAAE
ncbi:carbon-phosphorus lyase complex subunit PhnI [Devosia sp.]|uniref:carbon-phosphorus lyase complex subunit PhnI n=1 Tax=Devosia sp. TaxID=1871048 RepID=UPI0035B217DD